MRPFLITTMLILFYVGAAAQTPLPTFGADPSWASMRVEMDLSLESLPIPGTVTTVPLSGTMVVHYAAPRTTVFGTRVVDVEVMALDLSGQSPTIGNVRVHVSPQHTSSGLISSLSATSDFPADAELRLFFAVEVPNFGYTFAGGTALEGRNAAKFSAQNLTRLPWLFNDFLPDPPLFRSDYIVADFGASYRLALGTTMRAIQDPTFSVQRVGLSVLPYGDILKFGDPPATCIPAQNLGMFVPQDDLDALSYGYDFICPPEQATLIFSVDRWAFGAPNTDVDAESSKSPPQACGDEFVTTPRFPNGTNRRIVDQNQVRLQTAQRSIIDDMDGLDDHPCSFVDPSMDGVPDREVFYSVDISSFSMNEPNYRPGPYDPFVTDDDILAYCPSTGTRGIYASGLYDIGLLVGDGIDALCLQRLNTGNSCVLNPGVQPVPGFPLPPVSDYAIFSLTPNSPTLAGLNPLLPGGGSPGDIFLTNFSGMFVLYCTAASIGLLPTDNLDALKCPNAVTTWKVEGSPNLLTASFDFTYGGTFPPPWIPKIVKRFLSPGTGPMGAAEGMAGDLNADPLLQYLGIKVFVHESRGGALMIFEGLGAEFFTLSTTSTEIRLSRADGTMTPTCEFSAFAPSRTDLFDAAGPTDLLRINGSAGGLGRRVSVPLNQSISIEMQQSTSSPFPAPYVVFGFFGVPKFEDAWTPPIDLGAGMAFAPYYVDPLNPSLFVVADSFDPSNTVALVPGALQTPHVIATNPLGLPFPFEITMQGIVFDNGWGSPYLSFTNGVVLAVEDPIFFETAAGAIASSGLGDADLGVVFTIDMSGYSNDLETIGQTNVTTQSFFSVVAAGQGGGVGNGAAPDAVARFTATAGGTYTFDLCNSNYDSRMWLMPVTSNLPTPGLIMNDDADVACGPNYESKIENVCLSPGQSVLIVIDGYVSSLGTASLVVTKTSPNCATSGSIVPLTDDGAVPYVFQLGGFTFFGQTYSSVMVCMNGRLQFGGSGNSDFTETTNELRSQSPSINLFWDDLDPRPTSGSAASLTYIETATTFSVNYANVARYTVADGSCTGSITLDKLSGEITMSYAYVNPRGCIAGISPGLSSYPSTPPEVDLGSAGVFLAGGMLQPIFELFSGPPADSTDLSFRTFGFTPQGGIGIGPYLFHHP